MRAFRTARSAASFLIWVMDFLALAALAESSEVHPAIFAIAGAVFVACRFMKPRLSQGWLLAGITSVVVGTVAAWAMTKVHPIVAVAHGAPLAHLVLWLEGGGLLLGWRIGMGFIELIVASALSPDAFLPLVIICFVVVASVAIACGFLDRELAREAPEFRENPLPAGFIRRSLGFALLTFLSSALIFPLLPRMNGMGFNLQLGGASTGYVEQVNVSQWHGVSDENSSQVMLRAYSSDGLDLSTGIYLGLLRGRVLDRFDGDQWKPARPVGLNADEFRKQASLKYSRTPSSRRQLRIVREALSSSILPIPYGTLDVMVGEDEDAHPGRPSRSGEWREPGTADAHIRYKVDLTPNDLSYLRDRQPLDPPTEIHRFVPESLRNERMNRLARRIFDGARTDGVRVQRLLAYFRSEGFGVPDPAAQQLPSKRAPAAAKFSALEEFLFIGKEGHCEWYASATGVLLRLAGIPTRLVAGFRLSKGASGGVLTVRSRDAHAWVEAWTRERGWIPIDPTPRITRGTSVLESLRDSFDFFAAYWDKYIVSYGERGDLAAYPRSLLVSASQDLSRKLTSIWSDLQERIQANRSGFLLMAGALLVLGAGAAAFIWAWFPWIFSIRWKVQEGPAALRRERIRMERLLRRRRNAPNSQELEKWTQTYERARFGAPVSAGRDVQLLRSLYEEVRKKSAA